MRLAFVFRLCALLLVTAGVMAQFRLVEGRFSGATLVYYTTQSNLLALVLFAVLTVRTAMGLRAGGQGSAGFFARFEAVGLLIGVLLMAHVFYLVDKKARKPAEHILTKL